MPSNKYGFSLPGPGEFSSYHFLGAEHQAAVELCKLPIRDIPVPLLHVLWQNKNPKNPRGFTGATGNSSQPEECLLSPGFPGEKEEENAKAWPDFASYPCTSLLGPAGPRSAQDTGTA